MKEETMMRARTFRRAICHSNGQGSEFEEIDPARQS